MKTRALVGLAISFALPIFAQQTNKADPQLRQRYLALVKKYDDALNKNDAAPMPLHGGRGFCDGQRTD